MGYMEALTAAGAEVLVFKEFGDWQGTWLAKVRYNGVVGWATDYFGSCPVCDNFLQAEEYARWDYIVPEEWTKELSEKYNEWLASFGRRYLDRGLYTQEEIKAKVASDDEWDLEAAEMIKFVEQNK